MRQRADPSVLGTSESVSVRRAWSLFWQHTTSSFLHSSNDSSTTCKNTQRTYLNKESGEIGVAGVAHRKSRRRHHKRIRRMKPAREDREGIESAAEPEGNMEDGLCCRQSEHSKTNGPKGLAWSESRTENRERGFAKNNANETCPAPSRPWRAQ